MMSDQPEPIVVTEENFGGLLVAAMKEAAQIARGKRKPARIVQRRRQDRSRSGEGR